MTVTYALKGEVNEELLLVYIGNLDFGMGGRRNKKLIK